MNNVVHFKAKENKYELENWPSRPWLPFEKDQTLRLNIRMAHILGLKEALILDHMVFLIELADLKRNGFYWLRISCNDLVDEIGQLWNSRSVQRAVNDLERWGILISTVKYNDHKSDRTKWYRVDHNKLNIVCKV